MTKPTTDSDTNWSTITEEFAKKLEAGVIERVIGLGAGIIGLSFITP
ncbi:7177_t:CDS:2 [Ambispora leptoticha]|uniref:7177_t:CDS:1 n=1 Tax=Ambispora leptoticha TaxID=144679 RepID=A0A9N8YW12_9GLOM|nr:7177_t:CDS:2 [Ambispora leptoticha]